MWSETLETPGLLQRTPPMVFGWKFRRERVMHEESIRESLLEREVSFGTWIQIGHGAVAEVLARVGENHTLALRAARSSLTAPEEQQ
jgi:hypothetical protein